MAGASELQKKQRREASLSSFWTITPVYKPLLQELARGHTNGKQKTTASFPIWVFVTQRIKLSATMCFCILTRKKKKSNKDAGKRKWLWFGSGILTLNRQVGPVQFRKPYIQVDSLFLKEK